jgi:hypothetical protein
MAENDFILAVAPDGKIRRVPSHYLDNPAFGFTLPPEPVKEPAKPGLRQRVVEPATPAITAVSEPAEPETKKEAGE